MPLSDFAELTEHELRQFEAALRRVLDRTVVPVLERAVAALEAERAKNVDLAQACALFREENAALRKASVGSVK